jgi:hypothetical protein
MAVLGSTTLTGCNKIPNFIAAGSVMVFHRTTAPTSWTKRTDYDNRALRVVNGNITAGGSSPFTSILNGSVSAHTLSTSEIPSHSHSYSRGILQSPRVGPTVAIRCANLNGSTSGSTGSTGSHTHGMDVAYVDIIFATKN